MTVLEAADFLAKDDPELAAIVVARLKDEGVDLRAPARSRGSSARPPAWR